jgi:DNA-nicking Smr family endonuclease
MRRPRHLSPEERALWDHVTRNDLPLKPVRKAAAPADAPLPAAPSSTGGVPALPAPLPRFVIGERADHRRSDDLLPGLAEDMARMPLRMDARAFGRMAKGKLTPEARIDLHGLTLAEAHPALREFILASHAAGRRLVLVITGKGKLRDELAPMPAREGVLRHQVPQWLAMAPLGPMVLQIAPAHLRHGGTGAYYVYLRRQRT